MTKTARKSLATKAKTRSPNTEKRETQFDPATHTVTFEEAAQICGVTPQWLRELERNGFFAKQAPNVVLLRDVIAGLTRSIHGVRPPEGFID